MTKVKGKNVSFGENQEHHWLFTEEGWIRLTEKGLEKAKDAALKNMEDCPKISAIKQFFLNLLLK